MPQRSRANRCGEFLQANDSIHFSMPRFFPPRDQAQSLSDGHTGLSNSPPERDNITPRATVTARHGRIDAAEVGFGRPCAGDSRHADAQPAAWAVSPASCAKRRSTQRSRANLPNNACK